MCHTGLLFLPGVSCGLSDLLTAAFDLSDLSFVLETTMTSSA